jgi:hypothetical protein
MCGSQGQSRKQMVKGDVTEADFRCQRAAVIEPYQRRRWPGSIDSFSGFMQK